MKLVELQSENKDEFFHMLGGAKPTMVLFYADWCGHCQRFQPEWEKIHRELSHYNGINVAQVSHNFLPLMPSHLQVQGFPTLQMIRRGVPVETYMGSRTRDSIVKFALDFIGEKPKPKKVAAPKKKINVSMKKPIQLARPKALKDKKKK